MMFYKEINFKETPIGEIPKNWEAVKLEDVILEIADGGTPSTKFKEYFNGDLPWVNIRDITKDIYDTERHLSQYGLKNSSAKLWNEGTVIFSFGASIGEVGIARRKLCTKQGIAGIVPDLNRIQSEFLYYVLLRASPLIKEIGKGMGSTINEVRPPKLRKLIVFSCPPVSEQQRIVEVLSTVDDTIREADEVIAKTERLKKGLMQHLLIKGIGHKEFKDTEIGTIPKEWKIVQLQDLISDIKNGFASGKRDKQGIVQIRMNNLTTDGRLLLETYLKVPLPENVNIWLLKPNDFLFNNTNSIDLVGKSAIFKGAPFPCTFSNHFTRLRFKEDYVLPEWILYHFIIHWEEGYFKSVAIRHVGQAAVHSEYLLKLRVPLPPLTEQHKIIEILSDANRKLELERNGKVKMEKIKQGLMDLLLTGKVRIKVGE